MNMATEYGVGVSNRFAFLGKDGDNDDDDGSNVTLTITPSKPAATVKKPDAKKVVKHENKANDSSSRSNAVKEKALPSKNHQNSIQDERKSARVNVRFSEEKTNQGPGSRGGFRRGGGGSNPAGPPNRRNYRGKWNDNSTENRDSSTDNGNTEEASESDKQPKWDDQNDATENESTTVEKMESEETQETVEEENENAKIVERTLTLTEWKALQVPREKPKFNIRKPGEGEVSTKLEKLVLKKREDDIVEQSEEYETDEMYYPQRAGKMKQISDVGFTTGYQKRRGGGRFAGNSTRGGGGDGYRRDGSGSSEQISAPDKTRGRPPRYGPRGARNAATPVPRIDDASDFPTLG